MTAKHTPKYYISASTSAEVKDVAIWQEGDFHNGMLIAQDLTDIDARHIVKCVNCHDELVEALEEAKDRITRLEGTWENAGILSEHIDQALANAQEE